jgi:hypothetical protein
VSSGDTENLSDEGAPVYGFLRCQPPNSVSDLLGAVIGSNPWKESNENDNEAQRCDPVGQFHSSDREYAFEGFRDSAEATHRFFYRSTIGIYFPCTLCGFISLSAMGAANTAEAVIQTTASAMNAVIMSEVAGFSSCVTVRERAICNSCGVGQWGCLWGLRRAELCGTGV